MAVPVLLLASLISLADFAISETMVPIATREPSFFTRCNCSAGKSTVSSSTAAYGLRVPDGFMSATTMTATKKCSTASRSTASATTTC